MTSHSAFRWITSTSLRDRRNAASMGMSVTALGIAVTSLLMNMSLSYGIIPQWIGTFLLLNLWMPVTISVLLGIGAVAMSLLIVSPANGASAKRVYVVE